MKCKACGEERPQDWFDRKYGMPEHCWRCRYIHSKRTEIATAIAAGMLNSWLNINEEQVKQCVVKADWLIAELCRVKP